jgi:hypothetical protein
MPSHLILAFNLIKKKLGKSNLMTRYKIKHSWEKFSYLWCWFYFGGWHREEVGCIANVSEGYVAATSKTEVRSVACVASFSA